MNVSSSLACPIPQYRTKLLLKRHMLLCVQTKAFAYSKQRWRNKKVCTLYSTQPHQHPHTSLHQTQVSPDTIITLIFKPKPHLNTEKVRSHAWLVRPGASGRERPSSRPFCPFCGLTSSHYYDYMGGGTSTDARPKPTRLKKKKTKTNKPWKTPNPAY